MLEEIFDYRAKRLLELVLHRSPCPSTSTRVNYQMPSQIRLPSRSRGGRCFGVVYVAFSETLVFASEVVTFDNPRS